MAPSPTTTLPHNRSDLYDSWTCLQITVAGAPTDYDGNPCIPAIFTVTSTGCCEQSAGSCSVTGHDDTLDADYSASDCNDISNCAANPDITVAAVDPHVVLPGGQYPFPPAQVSKAHAQPTKSLHNCATLCALESSQAG